MNFEEQIAHRLGQKHGADFANRAASEQLASLRRAFGQNAEAILLQMHAKVRPNSAFALSGYFALSILGEQSDRRRVEQFWQPYCTGDSETDSIYDEPYYLLGFIAGALARRATGKPH